MSDSRANSKSRIVPPAPLPYVSRRALRRVKDRIDPPSSCPYCDGPVALVENSEIYNGRSYGDWPYAYLCAPCDAYVGLHPHTDLPLGTLANRELRSVRSQAKVAWQAVSRARGWDRSLAYQWLASEMGIPAAECHFGHFNLERALAAREICESAT
ncbi:MAG: hypothetical protein CME38_01485 [Haliea sp.]|nr:hypothetical protein [Haliea sp.]